jgi:hypothetical protein
MDTHGSTKGYKAIVSSLIFHAPAREPLTCETSILEFQFALSSEVFKKSISRIFLFLFMICKSNFVWKQFSIFLLSYQLKRFK